MWLVENRAFLAHFWHIIAINVGQRPVNQSIIQSIKQSINIYSSVYSFILFIHSCLNGDINNYLDRILFVTNVLTRDVCFRYVILLLNLNTEHLLSVFKNQSQIELLLIIKATFVAEIFDEIIYTNYENAAAVGATVGSRG